MAVLVPAAVDAFLVGRCGAGVLGELGVALLVVVAWSSAGKVVDEELAGDRGLGELLDAHSLTRAISAGTDAFERIGAARVQEAELQGGGALHGAVACER